MSEHIAMLNLVVQNLVLRNLALRNLVLATLTLLPLTGIAHAQDNANTMLEKKDSADRAAAKEYMNRLETDEKYKATLQNLQAPPTSNDPWGGVRPTPSPAKPAASSSKTATKKTQ